LLHLRSWLPHLDVIVSLLSILTIATSNTQATSKEKGTASKETEKSKRIQKSMSKFVSIIKNNFHLLRAFIQSTNVNIAIHVSLIVFVEITNRVR